ncbi:uncharacterized protein K441DRAFT_670546 [Cenococcum geophilum 1.58]|uniref:uncharacterized protein n=1 Tax=Cenococcum geophilum 1.58 TaxID=794803 RepID=UPI000DC86D38|nr:hypothetical protein K441DRAFT_670546 [Cenococcum geophilum 1.58]
MLKPNTRHPDDTADLPLLLGAPLLNFTLITEVLTFRFAFGFAASAEGGRVRHALATYQC